jgi:hypothetical protein
LALLICVAFAEEVRTCVIQQSSLPIAVLGNSREPGIWEPRVSCCTVTTQLVARAQQRDCCPLGRTQLKSDLGCPHECSAYSRALKRGVFTARAAKDVLDLLHMTMGTVMFHVKQAPPQGVSAGLCSGISVPQERLRSTDPCMSPPCAAVREAALRSGLRSMSPPCAAVRETTSRSGSWPSDGMA